MKACGRLLLVTLLVLLDQQLRCAGYNYEDMIFEDLYKRLSDIEDRGYMAEAPETRSDYGAAAGMQGDWSENLMDARDAGMADLRDQEYLEHEGVDGFQHISGGAGEGSQHLKPEGTQNNTQEVKSDESLPFYCHPPNPCPKGQTDAEGCRSDIKDTAKFQKQWISGLMKSKKCTCDEEHMFSCPKSVDTINTNKGHAARDKLDDVLQILMNENEDSGPNPFGDGEKHETLVAKKSPGIQYLADGLANENPYLAGEKIRTVAKKG